MVLLNMAIFVVSILNFRAVCVFFSDFRYINRNFGTSSHQIDSPSRSDGIWDNSMQHLAPEGLIRSSVNFGA